MAICCYRTVGGSWKKGETLLLNVNGQFLTRVVQKDKDGELWVRLNDCKAYQKEFDNDEYEKYLNLVNNNYAMVMAYDLHFDFRVNKIVLG